MKNMKIQQFVLVLMLVVTALSGVSCAKKNSKTRRAKTDARILNAGTTSDSISAAESQDLSYLLTSVSAPEENEDGSNTVESEVNSRGQFLPFSTTHQGTQDAYGIYDDNIQGTKLDIRARCIGAGCEQYVLLVTVVKNGYAYHQMAAISFKEDDFYYVEQRNYQRVQLYKNVDEVLSQHSNLSAGN